MKIKALIALFIGVLILLVWLERFLPKTKHNISTPRRLLRSVDEYFTKKSHSQKTDDAFSWRRSISIIILAGGFLFLMIWDSFS